ncbi:AAA family ATPase [[Brevibacterium] frigoritolerans]|nr:AAA family ATPase [Peribacillus frigoritolerans]
MNKMGFYINKLRVSGPNVKDASVAFETGLNIISGPSDTGKSYIFECINYMLGSSDVPKKIKESEGYSFILMEISLYSGKTYTLKRTFGKNTVEIFDSPSHSIKQITPEILSCKHDKEKTNNLSAFLLSKSGFAHPSYVLKKKTGDTRTVSFRDFPIFITIDETKVIKDKSPILSGQFVNATVEKSVFKFIVSGLDDSQKGGTLKDDNASKVKLEGQIELLERLIYEEEKSLFEFPVVDVFLEIDIESEMQEMQEELQDINTEIIEQTSIRRNLWNKIEEDKSKYIAASELLTRFNLLEEQYKSDLKRLSFVREGNYYFSQLNLSVCPYCNQRVEDTHEKVCAPLDNDVNLSKSIEAEINKINIQIKDLESTIKETTLEQSELLEEIERNKEKYESILMRINQKLEPKETNLKEKIDSFLQQRDLATDYNVRKKKIEYLTKEKIFVEDNLKKQPEKITLNENDGVVLNAYQDFCEFMSNVLKRWNFSKETNVIFKDGQFYVDNKLSKDYGKGYRAIIYSAFTISLMEYCNEKKLPHPGFVVLDSPLTTYQGKKSNRVDEVSDDIQTAFFKDLSKIGDEVQIIILENKEPDESVKDKMKYIEFTKDKNTGRYGFFN